MIGIVSINGAQAVRKGRDTMKRKFIHLLQKKRKKSFTTMPNEVRSSGADKGGRASGAPPLFAK
jgi:hypothetical protein